MQIQLYKNFRDSEWIIDDESYFTSDHSSINGNRIFYSSDTSLTPPSVKYIPTAKYSDKILVWITILSKGVSKPFFRETGNAINLYVYLERIFSKHTLLKLICLHTFFDESPFSTHFSISVWSRFSVTLRQTSHPFFNTLLS